MFKAQGLRSGSDLVDIITTTRVMAAQPCSAWQAPVLARPEDQILPTPSLRALLALSLLLSSTLAIGAEPGTDPGCSTIAGASERLACYDRKFPPASGASTVVDREAERVKALQEFGLTHAQLVSREPEQDRPPEFDQISAHVLRVLERVDGQRVVTLDNGQKWLLTEGTSKGWLRPGDAVSIRKAALGTFLLMTPSRYPLRARRIE